MSRISNVWKELPVWNVFTFNFNGRKVEVYNIFDFGNFRKDIEEVLRTLGSEYTAELEEKIKRVCKYWFAHDRNWEFCIGDLPWWEYIEDDYEYRKHTCRWVEEASKIDVWQQIDLNWKVFLTYILSVCGE